MAERELRPTALINRTGCGLPSQSHKFPALDCRARLSGGQTSSPRGVMQTQKNTSATQGHSLPPANVYCGVTAKACRIFLESSKLILVSAGLTLAFSLAQTKKNNSSVFDILLKCNGARKKTETLCAPRHRLATVHEHPRKPRRG